MKNVLLYKNDVVNQINQPIKNPSHPISQSQPHPTDLSNMQHYKKEKKHPTDLSNNYRKEKKTKKKPKHGLHYKPSVVVKPVVVNMPVQMEKITEDVSIDTICHPNYPCAHFVSIKGRSGIWGARRIAQYCMEHGVEIPGHFSKNVEVWHFHDQ